MTDRVVLRAGQLEVHLLPQVGGSIARFDFTDGTQRQPLMRGIDLDNVGPLDVGCFPLVPFANRIRCGAFEFQGRTIRLAPNMLPDPSPLHGQGWLHPWQLTDRKSASAELRYVHAADEWPWQYEACQRFALDDAGLSIVLECLNLADEPMPCALGLHPYHDCDSVTVLDANVATVWTVDAAVLPLEQQPATGRYDLRERHICGQALDNGFGGWNGVADIRWAKGSKGLRLSAADAAFFQVYSPESGGYFAAEPVQNANAALNAPEQEWAGLGIGVLDPGETRRLTVRYDLIAD
ncbi:MAG: aldose 1-epimerase [Pseudomonadota bacterium]